MENIVFSLAQLHQYGAEFYDFLKLRKRFFVDQLGWEIPHDDDVEMDQYDNPTAYYSLIVSDGVVVAGTRVMPTTAQWGSHTYMLRDAVAGKLIGIPKNILPAAESTANVWEVTRTVIADDINTQEDRSVCLSMMLDGAVDVAKSRGATELLSLSPVAMSRTLRKLGYKAERIGEPYRNAEDGRRYACISMPTVRSDRRIVVPTKVTTAESSAGSRVAKHPPAHAVATL
ncbi:acyl-homoserine-lactone synthase [Yoonia sp. 2307UL14-13]|uniref:acyl-homoserine-lactone synthase n=1 Tax=Yoonia sp. 2307UL14-13 TaxID=3126506 RepID=UPI0030A91C8B